MILNRSTLQLIRLTTKNIFQTVKKRKNLSYTLDIAKEMELSHDGLHVYLIIIHNYLTINKQNIFIISQ